MPSTYVLLFYLIDKGENVRVGIKKYKIVLLALCILIIFSACQKTGYRDVYLGEPGFNCSSPEQEGMDTGYLNRLEEHIKSKHTSITSFIIIKNGSLVWEKYYNETARNTLIEIHSITKAFVSAMSGIAINTGLIDSVNHKIIDFFPEYQSDKIQYSDVTVEDLLTMSPKIPWDDIDKDFGSMINKIKYSTEPFARVKVILEFNPKKQPAEEFLYHSTGIRLLSGIIGKQANMSDLDFIKKYLFSYLEITEFAWPQDIEGLNIGGKDLYLRSVDIAKLGQLYIQNGKWNGEQIIPENWIEESTKSHVYTKTLTFEKQPEEDIGFGYSWWVSQSDKDMYFSFGKNGQYLFVIPEIKTVVVITSNEKPESESYRYLVNDYIFPAILK